MITIYQKASKLIKNFALLTALLPLIAWSNVTYQMANPENKKVTVRLALTRAEHQQGLSGIKDADFPVTEAMLFVNDSMGTRRFWMPDTYFKLDIVFLDSQLKVVGIEKDVPFHPGLAEPPVIYRTKSYEAQFVLETKGSSPFSKKLKVGDKLKWISLISLSEIVLKTRRSQ
ncbi:DUF192 domain-containing protein [Bacteriovorax stolpii]|uniref:DUF192 domain-containing protein n=1 Tax=Bacteriovorax stolpii TaxID=960 RepID=UPI00163BD667|nr:DUF192 domain-containing protein [Bacteriovorax stolpii]